VALLMFIGQLPRRGSSDSCRHHLADGVHHPGNCTIIQQTRPSMRMAPAQSAPRSLRAADPGGSVIDLVSVTTIRTKRARVSPMLTWAYAVRSGRRGEAWTDAGPYKSRVGSGPDGLGPGSGTGLGPGNVGSGESGAGTGDAGSGESGSGPGSGGNGSGSRCGGRVMDYP